MMRLGDLYAHIRDFIPRPEGVTGAERFTGYVDRPMHVCADCLKHQGRSVEVEMTSDALPTALCSRHRIHNERFRAELTQLGSAITRTNARALWVKKIQIEGPFVS